jgi:hypothetical protein
VRILCVVTAVCAYLKLFAGAYVTTSDALDPTISSQELWEKEEFERALALVATRKLIFERGGSLVGKDTSVVHGNARV